MPIPPQLISWAGKFGIGAGMYIIHRLLSVGPVQESFESATWQANPNRRTPETVLVQLALWKVIDYETYFSKMERLGMGVEPAAEMLQSGESWADSRTIIVAGWREGQGESAIIAELVRHGWNEAEAGKFYTANKYYPSPSDLVHWQAREVFEEGMVSKYGLDDEFGEINLDAFHKAGMDDEQARNHWRAHWEHASWTEVQQMLFRGLIDENEVRDWFRLVEKPPFWRQKLIDSAYHPLTRVDVRRMHRTEVLSDADLIKAYKDVGFSEKNAKLMQEFTIAYNAGPEDAEGLQLTRAQIQTAYSIGFIGKGEAESLFKDIGYGVEEVDFILAVVDHSKALESGGSWVSLLRSQVKSGLITAQEAGNKLAALGFSSDAVSDYVELFAAYADQADKIPSKTDVKNFWAMGLISESDTKAYLKALGFADRDIGLYIRAWAPEPG